MLNKTWDHTLREISLFLMLQIIYTYSVNKLDNLLFVNTLNQFFSCKSEFWCIAFVYTKENKSKLNWVPSLIYLSMNYLVKKIVASASVVWGWSASLTYFKSWILVSSGNPEGIIYRKGEKKSVS